MASEIELRVQAYIAAQHDSDLDVLVEAASTAAPALLEVVKALGPYLTSEDEKLRESGVSLLGTIVARVPPAQMNRHATRTMLAFFCQKLEDTETVIPALKAIHTLTALPTFTAEDAVATCEALFSHVKTKAHVQSTRFVVYSIIDSCLAKHRDAFKQMGDTFIRGYIALAEGEKDPRNLILSFALVRIIILEFDFERFVDSLFDISFCYFPITFTPPPDDPYGISADDLKNALRLCLSSTYRFGPLAIPLFLEKITAGSPATKRETLHTMAVCWPVYGPRLAQEVGKQVWDTYKIEIFQPIDSDTQNLALTAVKALVTTLYGADGSEAKIAGLVQSITEECLRILREPEKSQAKPASQVVSALTETTLPVAKTVTKATVTHLMSLFLDPDEATIRPAILTALAALCTTIRKIYEEPGRDYKSERLLDDYKDQLLGAFTVELKNPPSSGAAIDGLHQMVLIPELLSNEELGFIVHNLNELLQTENANVEGDVRTALLGLFLATAKIAPQHIEQTTLPVLFSLLPDGQASSSDATKAARALSTLRTLCVAPVLFETLVIRLLARLELCEDALYALAMLNALQHVLSTKIAAAHPDVSKYAGSLVPKLYDLACGKPLYGDVRLLQASGSIVTLVARTLTAEKQLALANGVCQLLLNGDAKPLGLRSPAPKSPLNPSSSKIERNSVILLSAAMVPLRSDVAVPVPDTPALLLQLVSWCQQGETDDIQQAAAMDVVASIINKHVDDFNSLLNNTLPEILSLFSDPDVSSSAATALGRICGVGSLTKQNHAIIRILSTQRHFNSILPRILSGAESSADPVPRNASLIALTTMVRHVPSSIYRSDLPKMMPLLIRGLDLPDLNLRLNVIETLQTAAKDSSLDSASFSGRAPALAETMLRTAALSDPVALPVRIAALRYLGTLATLGTYEKLHPAKSKVIKDLGRILDDSKRSVRHEAVDAREKWYSLTA
ncbi:ARM repeat-containing protein [Auriculariales sp. MPI-PUGE-AT-0066]|nr:ARM repeat-containing protein [Auriculariales sp. MPI-PUGE-AT-0066]